MQFNLNPNRIEDYRLFLKIKELPTYQIRGRLATVPDEYAEQLGVDQQEPERFPYYPVGGLFDYQRDIASLAIRRRKFCLFVECGLGKTLIMLEFARAAMADDDKRVLIVSPLMVIPQTIGESERFYGDYPIEQVSASRLGEWMQTPGPAIGITNYEALRPEIDQGCVGALILDESSMLKSHYGKWGVKCLELGRGLEWKLAGTGTPAPNDRIEFANHAVFMDAFPTVNSFLATFFVNRGQTQNRWELKKHALAPFYRALSHWSIFLSDPSVYGWKDNAEGVPPVHTTIHDVPMTAEQKEILQRETGNLFAVKAGGITKRSTLGQIGKGFYRGREIGTNKPEFIKRLIESWPNESTLVWCIYNAEQKKIEQYLPDAGSITGDTPIEERMRIVEEFKAGRLKTLISKPKILGFGLNLQVATRQVFSGCQDSYESFYQAVKRSNRYGSTRPLQVHIPVTDVEQPMVDNVMRKAHRVDQDTREQEQLFKEQATWTF
mgnify:FL=1